ncbi:ATP-binding protein [Methylobacterium sp. J-026]|uniref:HD domain-containing protein n=1 Tax=Methylobacterium sp. J-026 TaxID=2836624 RepID=UPI001FB9AF56|nr:ATP-binding protein [Methylobacterium sp. J-026]MCJ2137423.1 ATP-binding protein [Methylobacterium sp. J-026]
MDYRELTEATGLWQAAFGNLGNGQDDRNSRHLAFSYWSLAERVKPILEQIHHVLDGLTVHDIGHATQLWEVATVIAGQKLTLNPLEAYILGAAFLLHDAGLAIYAYDGGREELISRPEYADALSRQTRSENGAPYHGDPLATPEGAKQRAIFDVLRQIHAEQAQQLVRRQFTDPSDTTVKFHLIEDIDLLRDYAEVIGKISASHNWPIQRVIDELSQPMTPGVKFRWTVEPLKLAALLRCADAAAIDERRAPTMAHVLARPHGVSADHWAFQARLRPAQVIGENNLLVFQSKAPFDRVDMDAWWLAFESLNVCHDEIVSCNKCLREQHLSTLHAEGVFGAHDPIVLSRCVKTAHWKPIDTTIKISDPTRLAKLLGGSQLYGDDPFVPLREILQNSADAIRARRLLDPDYKPTPENPFPGRIEVSALRDANSGDYELICDDDGVGMTEAVLTGPLITFGKSLWTDALATRLFPGLSSNKDFFPSGRFGIGFFSVFMISSQVTVISRPADFPGGPGSGAVRHVLAFRNGMNSRAEFCAYDHSVDGHIPSWVSTRIKLRVPASFLAAYGRAPGLNMFYGAGVLKNPKGREILTTELLERTGKIPDPDDINQIGRKGANADEYAFSRHCQRLVIPLDVKVGVRTQSGSRIDHSPHYTHWSQEQIGKQIYAAEWYLSAIGLLDNQLSMLREIKSQSGRILGRAALSIHSGGRELALFSIGGFLAKRSTDQDIVGVVEAYPGSASREAGIPLATDAEMILWAKNQLEVADALPLTDEEKLLAVASASRFDVDIYPLARINSNFGYMSIDQIVEYICGGEVVIIPATTQVGDRLHLIATSLIRKDLKSCNISEIDSEHLILCSIEKAQKNSFPVIGIDDQIYTDYQQMFVSRLLAEVEKKCNDAVMVRMESCKLGTYVGPESEKDGLYRGDFMSSLVFAIYDGSKIEPTGSAAGQVVWSINAESNAQDGE